MDSKFKGNLGVSKSISCFIENGYSIFIPFSDGTDQFDFIASMDGILIKVEVKSVFTKYRNAYIAQLKSIRPNRSKNVIHPFDYRCCDILATYIDPLDLICFVDSYELRNNRSAVHFVESNSKYSSNTWIISHYVDLNNAVKSVLNRVSGGVC